MTSPRLSLVLVLLVVGCGDDDGPARVCTPGASSACVGSGGCAGGQVCNAAGTGFGPCDCGGGADSGPGPTDGGPSDAGGSTDAGATDTGADAPGGPCDLVAQTGCASGERCSWISVGKGGAATCTADGSIALHGACTAPAEGEPDDCVAGLTCAGGRCARICDTSAGCDFGFNCSRYVSFAEAPLGACEPTCDPVRQTRLYDDAPACGSPDPGAPTLGCYGRPDGPYTCSPVAPGAASRTHRSTPISTADGAPYLNGCAPGYGVILAASTGSSDPICTAYCDPAETYVGNAAERQGTPPHTCPARGAIGSGEECIFLELYQTDAALPGLPEVGLCFDHTLYTYDHDSDGSTPMITWPSCADLPNTDTDGDGIPQHIQFGCGPRSAP